VDGLKLIEIKREDVKSSLAEQLPRSGHLCHFATFATCDFWHSEPGNATDASFGKWQKWQRNSLEV